MTNNERQLVNSALQLIELLQRYHRERRVAISMLYQLGEQNVEARIAEHLKQPVVQQKLDLELHEMEELKHQLQQYSQTGKLDPAKLLQEKKPN